MSAKNAKANADRVRVPVEDPEALTTFLQELLPDASPQTIALLVGIVTRQNLEIQRLAAAIGELRRGRSGGASERLGRDQLSLLSVLAGLGQAGASGPQDANSDRAAGEAASDEGTAGGPAADRGAPGAPPAPAPRKPKRGRLSERHPKLPVRDTVLRVEDRVCPVCGADKVCLGHDESEVLQFEPAQFYIERLLRERLACPEGHDGVVVAPPADKPFDGGIPGTSVVTELLERKVVDHLPVNRIHQAWTRLGLELPASTVYDWFTGAGELATPVAEAIRDRAIATAHLTQADDTTVKILDRDAEKGRVIGHMWGCVGDSRFAAYFATKTWQAGDAWQFLKSKKSGWLQGDGYAGYAPILKTAGTCRFCGCWAHARRYFVKARDKGDHRAEPFLVLIGQLFAVEGKATEDGIGHEERLRRRVEQSKPVLDMLVIEINRVSAQAPPKSPLGRAITYLTNQRQHLRMFLEDGHVPIENNAAERILRPIAVGRKGWLFFGSKRGADAGAVLFTIVGTAKLHGVNLRLYLRWLFDHLARRAWSKDQAGRALLPEHFAAEQAAQQQAERVSA